MMKILLITAEEWNDAVHGNNVLTNWFLDFPAEFAHVYCSPGKPNNTVCHQYFRITDAEMLRSIFGKKAGREIFPKEYSDNANGTTINAQREGVYQKMKVLSTIIHSPVIILREAIWYFGRYDKNSLQRFIEEFAPDIVFCPRLITPRLMRLESMISRMTDAPFVAFTADNEVSFNCYSWSPLFWLRRLAIHHSFKKHVGLYRHYFMFSEDQAHEYHQQYGLPTSCLYKCGSFADKFEPKSVNKPIRMIYAGRLYCNRWKTLAAIGEALEKLNQDEERMFLDVYTADILTRKQQRVLGGFKHLHVHAPITSTQLTEEYKKADIALHVESFDKEFRLATRYSFSTKIIDLMASSCAIMAICWEKHAGYTYLKQNDAAICISDNKDIQPTLQHIIDQPNLIEEYAHKAWLCGVKNHTKEHISETIMQKFNEVIKNNKEVHHE